MVRAVACGASDGASGGVRAVQVSDGKAMALGAVRVGGRSRAVGRAVGRAMARAMVEWRRERWHTWLSVALVVVEHLADG